MPTRLRHDKGHVDANKKQRGKIDSKIVFSGSPAVGMLALEVLHQDQDEQVCDH